MWGLDIGVRSESDREKRRWKSKCYGFRGGVVASATISVGWSKR